MNKREEMREPAKRVSEILQVVAEHVREGVSTFDLECICEMEIKKQGVFSYNKGYHPKWARTPFPATLCTSVNDVVAHGIPSKNVVLKEGDIINLDLGIIDKNGNCGDGAFTLPVGTISSDDQMLLRYAKKTTYAGIAKIEPGEIADTIARAMQRKADERHFVINHQMVSHGIGRDMHEEPLMYNVVNHYSNQDKEKYLRYEAVMSKELKAGMVVCIEPILTKFDRWGLMNSESGWQVRTRDKQKSAFFEHMVLVTDDGYEILTNHFAAD